MKDLKKVILIMSIIVIIIFIAVVVLFVEYYKDEEIQGEEKNRITQVLSNEIEENVVIESDLAEVNYPESDERYYYYAKSALDNFITYVNYLDTSIANLGIMTVTNNESEVLDQYRELGKTAIADMLDEQYKSIYNLSNDDIYNKLVKYANKDLYIQDMYVANLDNNMHIAIIYVRTKANDVTLNLIIKLDSNNSTYTIFMDNYLTLRNYDKDSMNIQDLNISTENIERKDYNIFVKEDINDEKICQDYFYQVKQDLLNYQDFTYNILNSEYKEKSFNNNIGSYKNYIQENYDNIKKSNLVAYSSYTSGEYNVYKLLDNYNNTYVIYEIKPFQYMLTLDDYTITNQNFIEIYEDSDELTKCNLILSKIKEAIIKNDYNYLYEHLADSFKNKYFNNYSEFESYLKGALFEKNSVSYGDIEKVGSVYKCVVYFCDRTGYYEDELRTKNINISLQDNGEYKFSFNIE